ncbi:MAG: hypothetical protein ACK4N5_02230, partial [Myxococcales bacterium]
VVAGRAGQPAGVAAQPRAAAGVKQAGKKGEVSRDTILFAEQEKAFKAREMEIAKAMADAAATARRAREEVGFDVADRRRSFGQATMTEEQLFGDLTQGLKDFNAALAAYEAHRLAAIQELEKAEAAKARKDLEAAEAAERAARAHGAVAEEARKASEAFAAQAAQRARVRADANANIEGSVLSQLGAVGSVITSFKSAMEKTGDIFTAVSAALLAVVMQSESFQRLVGVLNDALGGVADTLGVLIEPLIPAFKFAGQMLVLLAQAVMPFVVGGSDFQQVFNSVAPMLQILVELLIGFMPVIEMVGKAFLLVTNPLLLLGYALKPFFGVVRDVAAWMLQGAILGAEWWNLAMYTLKGIFNRFINVVAGAIGEGDITRAMRSFVSSIIDVVSVGVDPMKESLGRLRSMTWDSASAAANGLDKAASAANKLAEALTNVPDGYKVQAARFKAMADGMSIGTGGGSTDSTWSSLLKDVPRLASGGRVDEATLAIIGEGGEGESVVPDSKAAAFAASVLGRGGSGGVTIHANFYGVTSAREIWAELKQLAQREATALTGGLLPPAPRFVGR